MALKTVQVELPEELWELAGISPTKASAKVREFIIMELLRQAKISQGRAAQLLGVDRWELMDLMGKYEVPATQLTAAELDAQQEGLRKLRKRTP